MKRLNFLLIALFLLALSPGSAFAITNIVPEPTSLLLIVSGFVGVLGFRRIFKK